MAGDRVNGGAGPPPTSYITSLKVGDTLSVDNGRFRITLGAKKGRLAQIKIESDNWIKISKDGVRQSLTPPPPK